MDSAFAYRMDFLKQEIEILQGTIRSYDTIIFAIKSWAITLVSAALFLAVDKGRLILCGVAAAGLLLFWLQDAAYKSIQGALISRHRSIERYIQSPAFDQAVSKGTFGSFPAPGIASGFPTAQGGVYGRIWRQMLVGYTYSLYVFLLAVDAIVFASLILS